jgi:hypothetical protein
MSMTEKIIYFKIEFSSYFINLHEILMYFYNFLANLTYNKIKTN